MSIIKPTLKIRLKGLYGNVFHIIASVSRTLHHAGQPDRAREFTQAAFRCASFDAVITLVHEFVDVEYV
jgi:hypothetical protein